MIKILIYMINIENDSIKTYLEEVDSSVKKIHIYNQYIKRDSSKNDEKYIEKIKNIFKKDNNKNDLENKKKIIFGNDIKIIKNRYNFKINKLISKDILI
jgi:hypothetical protein